MRYRLDRLSQEMLKRDEDITDNGLWRLRRIQLDELLQGGRVLAVKASRDARETGTANAEITVELRGARTPETTETEERQR